MKTFTNTNGNGMKLVIILKDANYNICPSAAPTCKALVS